MDTTSRSFGASRLARYGAGLIAIFALAAIGAVVWPSGDSDPTPDQESGSAAPPTSVASPAPPTSVASPAPAPAAGGPSAAPAPRAVPAAAVQDGRHAVYLTDVDVPGSTVEFDLLQYLATDEDREAYEHSHPEDGEDYPESPFRNDNAQLRRLPVVPDLVVVVQQTGPEGCDGEHMLDFAAFSENLRGRSYGTGRLGVNPFWLTVHDGTVVGLEELGCMG